MLEKMTFLEFWNSREVKRVTVFAIGMFRPVQFTNNLSDVHYFDLGEWVSENDWLYEVSGVVSEGLWYWDGEGDPVYLSNSVLNIVAE